MHVHLIVTTLTGMVAYTNTMPTALTFQDISACPLLLPDHNFEFPHLIIPTNKSDIIIGNSYFADVSPNDRATSFDFDIPSARANEQCILHFSLPRRNQLETADYKWNGANAGAEAVGSLQFVQYRYNTGATLTTTGNIEPPFGPDPPVEISNVLPGNSYKVWNGSCGTGGVMSWRLRSTDSSLMYFQDWNACAIGLWIVYENVGCQPLLRDDCPDEGKVKGHAA